MSEGILLFLVRILLFLANAISSCFTVKLNANRHVVGVLRGYDAFMNLVLDETVEQGQEKHNLGMVVGFRAPTIVTCPSRSLTRNGQNL